jgi:bacteriorhodopsin
VTNIDSAPKSTATGTAKNLLRTGGIAIVAAGVLNTIIGLIADAAGVGMEVKGFGSDVREAIPVFAYFVSTVFGGAIGIVLALIMRRAGAAKKIFYIVTGVLTLLSLISPLTADATSGTKVILEIMHVLAAAIIIPALAKSLRD